MLHIDLSDILGEHINPEGVPEWEWIKRKACYSHVDNGSCGIWEFILVTSNFEDDFEGCEDAPDKLKSVIKSAIHDGHPYILIHQYT